MPRIRNLPVQSIEPEPTLSERRRYTPAYSSSRHYTTYGLTIASQLELPELKALPPVASPDIQIHVGDVSGHLEGAEFSTPWLQCTSDRCQFLIDRIARFRVEHGKSICVDRRPMLTRDATPDEGDLRVYLLGTAMGALLHQKHWMPLHISAVETPSGVWGFTGKSGAGKSTLAAWLHYRYDWKLVSDDVGVIKPEERVPTLYPGPPRLKLWKDALECLGIERQGLVRDLTRTEKFHLNQHQGFKTNTQPLRTLVMLERGTSDEKASIESLAGVEAFKIVMSALYLPEWGQRFIGSARLMQYGANLARQVRVFRYRRPWSLETMGHSLAPLVEKIHESVEQSTST